MGSTMKRSIFDEQTSKALKKWHKNAVKKKDDKATPTQTLGGSPPESPMHSPKRGRGGQPLPANITATVDVDVDVQHNGQPHLL